MEFARLTRGVIGQREKRNMIEIEGGRVKIPNALMVDKSWLQETASKIAGKRGLDLDVGEGTRTKMATKTAGDEETVRYRYVEFFKKRARK